MRAHMFAADRKVAKLAVGVGSSTGAVIAVVGESGDVTEDASISALVNTLGGHGIAAASKE